MPDDSRKQRTKTQVFEADMKPLLDQVASIAVENDIHFVATFETDVEEGHDTPTLRSSWHLLPVPVSEIMMDLAVRLLHGPTALLQILLQRHASMGLLEIAALPQAAAAVPAPEARRKTTVN